MEVTLTRKTGGKKFKKLDFYEYLFEVGMFDKGKDPSDKDARDKA